MKLLFENWRQYLEEQTSRYRGTGTYGGLDFAQAIRSAQPGDQIRIQVLIPLEKYYQTIFKPGKVYNAIVGPSGNKITIDTEPLPMGYGSRQTMTKSKFIKNIQEKARELRKDPCEIVACTKSIIIRGGERKTFAEYLKNPTFKTKREEPPIKTAQDIAGRVAREPPRLDRFEARGAREAAAMAGGAAVPPQRAHRPLSPSNLKWLESWLGPQQKQATGGAFERMARMARQPAATDIRAIIASLEPTARELRDEMLGAGSGKTVQIMIANKHQLAPLAAAFYKILTPEERIKNGGLAQWLNDEVGCHLCKTMWAPKVEAATSKRNYKV